MRIDDAFQKEKCCGCGACAAVCPVSALSMQSDGCGFLYPQVNNEACIHCGLCSQVCDFRNENTCGENKPLAYAFVHKDKKEVAASRSGAVFPQLSSSILERGGLVFGCAMQDIYTAVHKAAETKEEVEEFRGSKYIQSCLGDSFKQCAEALKSGRWVLFSGTGCQVHGLLSFLKKKCINTERLVTCDIVCHGVPSPTIWRYYMALIERKYGKVKEVQFRDKQNLGWRSHLESFKLENGEIVINKAENGFYYQSFFRPSCYQCKYTSVYRNSDITIGDFWGIEKVAPELNNIQGVSLVLLRSAKAKELFEDIRDTGWWKECSLDLILQPQLLNPTDRPKDYDAFWTAYCNNSQSTVRRWYFKNKLERLLDKMKNKLTSTGRI